MNLGRLVVVVSATREGGGRYDPQSVYVLWRDFRRVLVRVPLAWAVRFPLVVMFALLAVGALRDDQRWTRAAIVGGAAVGVGYFVAAYWLSRRDRNRGDG